MNAKASHNSSTMENETAESLPPEAGCRGIGAQFVKRRVGIRFVDGWALAFGKTSPLKG
jgi:hypothetical protein